MPHRGLVLMVIVLSLLAPAGRLKSSFGRAESGRRFVGELRTLLARAGYLRGELSHVAL